MRPLRLIFLSFLLLASASASAGWSANIGWASDYYYRGIFQKSSSASVGLDYDSNGLYVGTWIADVDGAFGDGLEVDGYFGYGGEFGDFGYGIGFTGYYYTGDFDDTYQEINLSGNYGWVTVDAAIGEYKNFDGPTQSYQFYSVTVERNGLYGKYGTFQDEASGSYVELGYSVSVAEMDLAVYLLSADENLSGGTRNESLIFTIGKAFDLK